MYELMYEMPSSHWNGLIAVLMLGRDTAASRALEISPYCNV